MARRTVRRRARLQPLLSVELDGHALDQLLLYPGSRRAIFAGKLLANFVFVGTLLAIVALAGIVLFSIRLPAEWLALLGVVVAGTIGVVTLGTFYAAMASRSRARDVLLPLLLFPMLVPVLLAAMQATRAILGGDVMGDGGAWIRLLIAFDTIFVVATFAICEYVIEV